MSHELHEEIEDHLTGARRALGWCLQHRKAAGLGLGMALARCIGTLLYGVKATDAAMLALPWLAILTVALLAASPAIICAVRIDPAATLRSE